MANLSTESPRHLRRQRELELRRADILQAASAVFAERGFDAAQVSEVAGRAEVSLATIYALFQNKEGLYIATLREISLRFFAQVDAGVSEIEDPVECLLAMVDALCQVFETEREALQLFMRDTTTMPWRLVQTADQHEDVVYGRFAEWIAEPARRAEKQGRLRVMSAETLTHFILGSVATALLRSVQKDSAASLLEIGASIRNGIERVFEPRPPRRRKEKR